MSYLELLYFFIPGYLANSFPPLLAKLLPKLNCPIDKDVKWRGKRLLGKNKTWRGLLGGTLLAGVVFLIQQSIAASGGYAPTSIPYAALPWWFGLLLGFGALFGDAVASFLKRQLGVPPGKPSIPLDQVDYTLGALLLISWLYWPGFKASLFLLLINGLLSASAHIFGYRLRINKEKL